MILPRLTLSLLIVFGLSCGARAECDPRDRACIEGSAGDKVGYPPAPTPSPTPSQAPSPTPSAPAVTLPGSINARPFPPASRPAPPGPAPAVTPVPPTTSAPPTTGIPVPSSRPRIDPDRAGGVASAPLQPVRAYLRAKDIPPVGAGAYGLVVFHSKATPANRSKLKMVCNAFVAFFPRQETSRVPLKDQMVTVWPLDNPDAKQAKKDDCDYAISHYDLNASEAAIKDARLQRAKFDGEGPYLVGWSPSNARGAPDKLVLVIDMSADNSQALIDQKFLFWKKQIVEDPSRWRNGFSIESVRAAIRIFADQYGQAMLDAIKLVGGK